jgi:CRISPR-associated protein Csb1
MRRIPGRDGDIPCVLIDSVQSQANRLEESLLAAAEDGAIVLPRIAVDFVSAGLDDLGNISSLETPHRVFDAILRDSLLDGTPFMKSEAGRRLQLAKMNDATALFELSPTALLFGSWNSTGEGGGLGAKFPRAIVSEIIGINVPIEPKPGGGVQTAGRRTRSRIDPIGILRRTGDYIIEVGNDWEFREKPGAKDKKKRPSKINHGNIAPKVQELGVTVEYAEQIAVVTFAGLRRLRFGGGERNRIGRAALAALGLLALLELDRQGYALRSRCDLVVEGTAAPEIVHPDGTTEPIDVDLAAARTLYAEAMDAARSAGFAIEADPLLLQPQQKLVDIVRRSRELALEGEGGEAEESGSAGA